jgi:hypothetical protein
MAVDFAEIKGHETAKRAISETMTGHAAHRAIDLLTNEVLRQEGYGEGIRVFETKVARWHAEGHAYPYAGPCPDCEAL